VSSLAGSLRVATTLGVSNPFPGLRPYEEEDASWFFGRGREINELLKRLRRVRFLAVVGPSGCGKSSLIKAGLLPAVRDGYLDADWQIAAFRPGEQPLNNLASALTLATPGDAAEIRKLLDTGPMGLVEAIKGQQLHRGTNTLILVDQFEELFQFVQRRGEAAKEEAKSFLKPLLTAAASDLESIYIVITMRLEWLNESATYIGLAEAINEGIYLVPQMSRRQFQQTILGPIEAANGNVTSALVDRMLNDLDGRADQLPVLQHALMRMWQQSKVGEPLGIANYEAVGTFSDCLSRHAGEIFREFDDNGKKAAELLFRSITQVFKNRKVRRPRPLGEIVDATGVPLERLKSVIGAFRKEGRSFIATTPGELTAESIIDISHEALIRQWHELTKWVEIEADVQSKIGRLQEVAAEWDREKRKDRDALYRGSVLKRAEEWKPRLDRASAAIAFLEASRRAEFWRRVKWRGLTGLLVLLPCALIAVKYHDTVQLADFAVQQAKFSARLDEALKQPRSGQAIASIQASAMAIKAKRVYLQYAGPQQLGLAQTLQSDLAKQGFFVPGPEDVGDKAPSQTEVRYFHESDKPDAESLRKLLLVAGPVVIQLTPNPKNLAPPGQFEVWLAATATPLPSPVAPASPPPVSSFASGVFGIAVSHHNRNVNWREVKNAEIAFAYLRATQGAGNVDPMFNDAWNAAKREGIIRGAYHFLIGGGATEQADNFVRTVGQLDPGDLPPVVVFQANPQGPSATVEDLVSWLEVVERRFGARPIIYSGNYLRTLVGASAPDKLLGYPIWLAQYGPTPVVPAGWDRWTFWQFTDGSLGPEPHSVPGLGPCDISRFNGSLQELKAFALASRTTAR
jgi:GH25 family lysozyme M1 (1,4-beta-N-acetylmuramidase)